MKATTQGRTTGKAARSTRRPARSRAASAAGKVLDLDARRIEKALEQRSRYKYVRPRVEREGLGWKVVSPNCSRNIDPRGGEIDIAWLVPSHQGGWLLYSRDHHLGCWRLRGRDTLPALLQRLGSDPQREFWQ
jgi:hypothetical protein